MGTASSGNRNGGKSLTSKFQRALDKALKQAEHDNNRKSLDVLLADLMQDDVAKFMQVASPYLPKEVIIDAGINLVEILALANQRTDQYLQEVAAARLSSDATTNTQAITVDSVAIRVDES